MAKANLYWMPGNPLIVGYQVFKAVGVNGPWWLQGVVSADQLPPGWDLTRRQHTWVDNDGDLSVFYKITGVDLQGLPVAECTPFQVSGVQSVTAASRVRIDEDYGGTDSLRFVDTGGAPITEADIRIFREVDYNEGRTETSVAYTRTRADGRWETPVYLPIGLNYVVQFYKPSGYGPTTVTITV